MKYPHLAALIFNCPLLVHPGKLDAIIAGLGERLLGAPLQHVGSQVQTPAPDMFSTRRGPVNEERGYRVIDGVAVLNTQGALVHRTRFDMADSTYFLGYNTLTADLEHAMDNPDVHAVLRVFDSPGGEVQGAFEAAERTLQMRGKKPLVSIADGMAASAAYLLGSASDELVITKTGYAGSIGVVARHVDFSQALSSSGIKVTHIFAGAHKVDGNPYEPLPESVRSDWQAEIEGIYAMFVDAVARHTGLEAKAIRATQARTYAGQKAVDSGLASRIGTTDELISELAALRVRSYPVGPGARATANDKGATMSGTEKGGTEAANTQPAAFAQADLDKARADGHAAGREEGMQAGVTAERERVSAILGHPEAADRQALAVQCITTGLSAEQAGAILGAAPKAAPAKAATSAFGAAMASIGNPDVSGIEGEASADDAAAVAGSILSVFRNHVAH